MPNIKPGLVSVTFRKLSPEEIIGLCADAGIRAIEWGGDVHAPDAPAAKKIAALMERHGMETVSLGSYYRAGSGQDFAPVLETALALGAPNVRIWAGDKNPDEALAEYRAAVIADARAACDMAARHGIGVSFEYHGNTLTSTQDSAVALLDEIGRANIFTYWQPLGDKSVEENTADVAELSGIGKLSNMHVYHTDGGRRMPLADGINGWKRYFAAGGRCGSALLEFVIDDDPARFIEDAATLIELLK